MDYCDDPVDCGSFFKPVQQCGPGPWSIFLMVNVAPNATKKTELKLHTYPNVVEFMQNNLHSSSTQLWRVVMSIGVFNDWLLALKFHHMWENGKRGSNSRILHGILLYNQCKNQFNLSLLITPFTKTETLDSIKSNKNEYYLLNRVLDDEFLNMLEYEEDSNESIDCDVNMDDKKSKSNSESVVLVPKTVNPGALNSFLEKIIFKGNYLNTLNLNKVDDEKAFKWWKLSLNELKNNKNMPYIYENKDLYKKTLAWILKANYISS